MTQLRVFKKSDNTWWMDFPEYITGGGKPENLQLIRGFDTLLDWAGNNIPDITMQLDSKQFHEDCRPMYKSDRHTEDGCYYFYAATDLISDHWGIWISNVIKLLFFGVFPNVIYFKIIKNGK